MLTPLGVRFLLSKMGSESLIQPLHRVLWGFSDVINKKCFKQCLAHGQSVLNGIIVTVTIDLPSGCECPAPWQHWLRAYSEDQQHGRPGGPEEEKAHVTQEIKKISGKFHLGVAGFFVMKMFKHTRQWRETYNRHLTVVVQPLRCVWLFVTPWTAACSPSLYPGVFSNSCPESAMLSNHLIFSAHFFCFQSSPASRSFLTSRLLSGYETG